MNTPFSLSARTAERSGDRQDRRTWVDGVRGLGIFLVVLGHTLRGLAAADLLPQAWIWAFLDRFIYAFHMPLFFFVAGLFLVPGANERYGDFAQRRLVRLGYPYLVWASMQTLSQVLLSRYTNHPMGMGDFLTIGITAPMQFWFLYALLLQTLFIGLLSKLGLSRGAILAVAVLVYLTAPVVPIGTWQPLNQARNYLLYTSLGVTWGALDRMDLIEHLRSRWYLLMSAVLFGFITMVVLERAIGVADRYLFAVVALPGISASVGLGVLLSRLRSPPMRAMFRVLERWGEASMAIFVAHTLASAATRIGLVKVLHTEDAAVHVVLGTLTGLCLPWVLYLFCKARKIPYVFEWPRKTRSSAALLDSTLPTSPAR